MRGRVLLRQLIIAEGAIMTLNCLVKLTTHIGQAMAEVRINSLHQLAVVMPASVVSYEVQNNGECNYEPVNDAELFDLLNGVISDVKLRQAADLD